MIKSKSKSKSKTKTKKRGAGTLILHKYNFPNGKSVKCVALGFEIRLSRTDERYHTYSISTGSYEKYDGLYHGRPHLWKTALRELSEEFKNIRINMGYQRKPDLHVGRTPLWIGHVRKGVSQKSFIRNREMSDFKYIQIQDILNQIIDPRTGKYIARTVKGHWVPVSKYAVSTILKASYNNLI